jgi:Beta-lactamase enzyme family
MNVGIHSARSATSRGRQTAAAVVAVVGAIGVMFLAHNVFGSHADATTHGSASESAVADASSSTTSASATTSESATTSASATPPSPSALPKAPHKLVPAASAVSDLSALDAGLQAGSVSVSATNLTTGATFSWGAGSGMVTASVVKLDTLETLLLQHQTSGQPLSSEEQDEATEMIENSDNDAADSLWDDVGSDAAVTSANKTFGLTATVAGTDDYWGLTTTSAADQVTLLKQLVGRSALTAASQTYTLGLMRSVESDQVWGVSAVADPDTSTALKNGWLAIDDDSDLWAVNSVGLVTVHGQQIALAIMTQHQSDEATGIDLVQRLAAATVTAVSS